MSQSVKISEVVSSINALVAAINTRFQNAEGNFANYLPINGTAQRANLIEYTLPAEELLNETPVNTATYLGNNIHTAEVWVSQATVPDELTLIIPTAPTLIEGWVAGGLNGMLTSYAYDVGSAIGTGKVIIRQLEVQGKTYVQTGQTWGTPAWGEWVVSGGSGDASTLGGKTLQEVIELAAQGGADFSVAPLNVFQGADYDAMIAVGPGHWFGPADCTNMHPATLNGVVTGYLEVTSVQVGSSSWMITRRVYGTYNVYVEHIEYINAESQGYTTGFGRVLTSLDQVQNMQWDQDTSVGDYLQSLVGDLSTVQNTLTDFIAAKATGVEVIAGTDDAKYTTALAVATAITKAIDDLVDGAPTALDTLKELATKLEDQDDALAVLVAGLDDKLDKTAQAADSLRLNGKTQAELTASNSEMVTGTETGKFATPAGVKHVLDPLAARVTTNEQDIDLLLTEMTAAFTAGATTIGS